MVFFHMYMVFVMSMSQFPSATNGGYRYGAAFDKRFVTHVSAEALTNSPRWTADSDHPPVSARKALKLGDEVLSKMERADEAWNREWTRHIAGLVLMRAADERWYWCVEFVWYPREADFDGQLPSICVIVLMDGKVIEPKAVDGPPPPGSSASNPPKS